MGKLENTNILNLFESLVEDEKSKKLLQLIAESSDFEGIIEQFIQEE